MKPGSVIERKAYFEAHFKKKGFPRPNLAECYSGTDYRVCGNDVSECDDAYREECELENEENSYAESDERSEDSVTSVYLGDFEVTECEKEDPELSSSDTQRAPALNHIAILVDGAVEDVNFEELHQPEEGCENSSIVEELERNVNENRNGDAENSEEPSKKSVNICSKTEPAECVDKTIVESGKTTSSKVWDPDTTFIIPITESLFFSFYCILSPLHSVQLYLYPTSMLKCASGSISFSESMSYCLHSSLLYLVEGCTRVQICKA